MSSRARHIQALEVAKSGNVRMIRSLATRLEAEGYVHTAEWLRRRADYHAHTKLRRAKQAAVVEKVATKKKLSVVLSGLIAHRKAAKLTDLGLGRKPYTGGPLRQTPYLPNDGD